MKKTTTEPTKMNMKKDLLKRKEAGNLRELTLQKPNLIDFASNDYLGFARSNSLYHNVLIEWEKARKGHAGLGATGSRLLTGNSEYAEELENLIAAYHKSEAGLIFNSGYTANLGLLSTILKNGIVIYDQHVHASMKEGIRLSRASAFPFFHQNLEHLEKRLSQATSPAYVCIESLYSMDGEEAPLKEICCLCEKYKASIIVDEAHAAGIIGAKGEGLVAHHGLENQVFARIVTFGKALGVCGAIVLGSSTLKKYLINFCSAFIYTTSLPLCCLATIKCAYRMISEANQERNQLQKLKNYMRSATHIIPIYITGNHAVKKQAQKLLQNGIDVRPILRPTVKRGKECLRVCLHSYNTIEELNLLCRLL